MFYRLWKHRGSLKRTDSWKIWQPAKRESSETPLRSDRWFTSTPTLGLRWNKNPVLFWALSKPGPLHLQGNMQQGPKWETHVKGIIISAIQISFLQNESLVPCWHHLETGQSEKQTVLSRLLCSLRWGSSFQIQMPPLPGSLSMRVHLELMFLLLFQSTGLPSGECSRLCVPPRAWEAQSGLPPQVHVFLQIPLVRPMGWQLPLNAYLTYRAFSVLLGGFNSLPARLHV